MYKKGDVVFICARVFTSDEGRAITKDAEIYHAPVARAGATHDLKRRILYRHAFLPGHVQEVLLLGVSTLRTGWHYSGGMSRQDPGDWDPDYLVEDQTHHVLVATWFDGQRYYKPFHVLEEDITSKVRRSED